MAKTSKPSGYLAVDIGGTKLGVGIVSTDGKLISRQQLLTPTNGVWQALVGLIVSQMQQSTVQLTACGVGCGGPMTLDGRTVSPLNIPEWRGFELRDAVVRATGLPTFIANDAQALALGETWCGAAIGLGDVIGMVVSTGVGGGIVSAGKLLKGRLGNAGHIGHVIVEPGGRLCACGAQGCLEAHISGRSIESITGKPASQATPDVIARAGLLLGRALASVAAIVDVQLAIVGGSVALGFGKPFFTSAQQELDRSARIEFARGFRILPVGLGDEAPLIGAASVARAGD